MATTDLTEIDIQRIAGQAVDARRGDLNNPTKAVMPFPMTSDQLPLESETGKLSPSIIPSSIASLTSDTQLANARLTGTILDNILDKYTGQSIQAKVTTEISSDSSVDNIIYFKYSGVYFKRVIFGDVYPEWFGATGDGITDDSSAINSAITYAQTIRGTVVLSKQFYYCGSNTINIYVTTKIKCKVWSTLTFNIIDTTIGSPTISAVRLKCDFNGFSFGQSAWRWDDFIIGKGLAIRNLSRGDISSTGSYDQTKNYGIGLSFDDTYDSTSGNTTAAYVVSMLVINNLSIRNFYTNIKTPTSNFYLTTFRNCVISYAYSNIELNLNVAKNSGENVRFENCTISDACNGVAVKSSNVGLTFSGCSFDFCQAVFNFTGTGNGNRITLDSACHLEGWNKNRGMTSTTFGLVYGSSTAGYNFKDRVVFKKPMFVETVSDTIVTTGDGQVGVGMGSGNACIVFDDADITGAGSVASVRSGSALYMDSTGSMDYTYRNWNPTQSTNNLRLPSSKDNIFKFLLQVANSTTISFTKGNLGTLFLNSITGGTLYTTSTGELQFVKTASSTATSFYFDLNAKFPVQQGIQNYLIIPWAKLDWDASTITGTTTTALDGTTVIPATSSGTFVCYYDFYDAQDNSLYATSSSYNTFNYIGTTSSNIVGLGSCSGQGYVIPTIQYTNETNSAYDSYRTKAAYFKIRMGFWANSVGQCTFTLKDITIFSKIGKINLEYLKYTNTTLTVPTPSKPLGLLKDTNGLPTYYNFTNSKWTDSVGRFKNGSNDDYEVSPNSVSSYLKLGNVAYGSTARIFNMVLKLGDAQYGENIINLSVINSSTYGVVAKASLLGSYNITNLQFWYYTESDSSITVYIWIPLYIKLDIIYCNDYTASLRKYDVYTSLTTTSFTKINILNNQGILAGTVTSGATASRPTVATNFIPVGFEYLDTTLGQPIWHKGADVWVDKNGVLAGTVTSGATASRPTVATNFIPVGFNWFDTTLGKPIFLKDSTPTWVDATGTTV